jgi:hypothetical protein
MAAKKLPARDQQEGATPTESSAAKPRAQDANEDNQPRRRGAVITIATVSGAALRTTQCALQCNSQGLMQVFSINETSKLLSRQLAHFVAAIDQMDFTRTLRLAERRRTCCVAKPRCYFQVDRMVKTK